MKRCVEYIKELLNTPAPVNIADTQPAEECLEVTSDNKTREEITTPVMTLNNGTYAGPDGIPAEAFKADMNKSIDLLYRIYEKICDEQNRKSGKTDIWSKY